jgi:hypothetical protein
VALASVYNTLLKRSTLNLVLISIVSGRAFAMAEFFHCGDGQDSPLGYLKRGVPTSFRHRRLS